MKKKTGTVTLSDPQPHMAEPKDSVRIHIFGVRSGYIGSTLIDETEQRRLYAQLQRRLEGKPS